METKLINLTPHPINILDAEGNVIYTLPKAEKPLRLAQHTERVGVLNVNGNVNGVEIPITKTKFGGADELPPKIEGTYYIVSLITVKANPDREDFLFPNELVRDENGNIIGAKSLSR